MNPVEMAFPFKTLRMQVPDLLDRLCRAIVWRLPARFVNWAAIRVIAHATTGAYSTQVVPDLTALDALKRWEKDFLR